MDPDEALATLLTEAREVLATRDDPKALRLAEGVLNLHEWLRKGGYFPRLWAPKDENVDRGDSGL